MYKIKISTLWTNYIYSMSKKSTLFAYWFMIKIRNLATKAEILKNIFPFLLNGEIQFFS